MRWQSLRGGVLHPGVSDGLSHVRLERVGGMRLHVRGRPQEQDLKSSSAGLDRWAAMPGSLGPIHHVQLPLRQLLLADVALVRLLPPQPCRQLRPWCENEKCQVLIPSSDIISFLLLNKPKLSAQFFWSLFDKITPSKKFFPELQIISRITSLLSSDQLELI